MNDDMRKAVTSRFFEHLPEKIRCGTGNDKAMIYWMQKTVGVLRYEYVELPNNVWRYLLLDLDYENAGAAWYEMGMPHPTIILRTAGNGHALYFYELIRPVLRPGTNEALQVRPGPIEYFENVRRGYQAALNADTGYQAANCKNPLHPAWAENAIMLDRCYSLNDLAGYLHEVPSTPTARERAMLATSSSPNSCLFFAAKQWAGKKSADLTRTMIFDLPSGDFSSARSRRNTWGGSRSTSCPRRLRRSSTMYGLEKTSTARRGGLWSWSQSPRAKMNMTLRSRSAFVRGLVQNTPTASAAPRLRRRSRVPDFV